MTVSPIGLQKDLPKPVREERAAAEAPRREPVKAEAAGARSVAVDLPEPLPGRLMLDLDRETGRVIGRIVDKGSGKVIRQVPTDEALKLAASMKQLLKPLFSERV